jgi:hypothetical protein
MPHITTISNGTKMKISRGDNERKEVGVPLRKGGKHFGAACTLKPACSFQIFILKNCQLVNDLDAGKIKVFPLNVKIFASRILISNGHFAFQGNQKWKANCQNGHKQSHPEKKKKKKEDENHYKQRRALDERVIERKEI